MAAPQKRLHLGTHADGAPHVVAEIDGDQARLRGATGEPLVFSQRGAAKLGTFLLDWARPQRRARLWGHEEICGNLGISSSTLSAWRKHQRFPKPAAELAGGDVFWADQVKAFARDDRPRRGRPPKAGR